VPLLGLHLPRKKEVRYNKREQVDAKAGKVQEVPQQTIKGRVSKRTIKAQVLCYLLKLFSSFPTWTFILPNQSIHCPKTHGTCSVSGLCIFFLLLAMPFPFLFSPSKSKLPFENPAPIAPFLEKLSLTPEPSEFSTSLFCSVYFSPFYSKCGQRANNISIIWCFLEMHNLRCHSRSTKLNLPFNKTSR
jgi:hypothetical protein